MKRPFRALLALPLTALLVLAPQAVAVDKHRPVEKHRPQGALWKKDGTGPTYNAAMKHTAATRYGIREFQELLHVPRTGRYDAATTRAVLRYQEARAALADTGNIDYPTSRSLLMPVIRREARLARLDVGILCGHLFAESALDPGAVGPGGSDFGIAQIVPRYKPGTDPWDVQASVRRMAREDAASIRRYGVQAGPVAWWKPAEARRWAQTGRPSEAAADYRRAVAEGC